MASETTGTWQLTVIVRDERPVRYLNEPCALRTVRLALTAEQSKALVLGDGEAVSVVVLEPVTP